MTTPFPLFDKSKSDPEAEKTFSTVINVISSVRNIRGEMNLNPGLNLDLLVRTKQPEQVEILRLNSLYINTLARVKLVDSGPQVTKPEVSASSVWGGMDIFVPLKGKMDFVEEKKRIEKELKKIEKDTIVLDKKLSNRNFIDKAPPEVIEKDNQRRHALSEKQTRLSVHLETINQALS
jgi:valyl-tRNA synthetase